MRLLEFTSRVDELHVDNYKGLGATPNNAEVDYKGINVSMLPSVFLKLAKELAVTADDIKTIEFLKQHDKQGGTVGAPTLYINVPDAWKEGDFTGALPHVADHDGRHRMLAQLELQGNEPVETHIFLTSLRREWRNHDITPELLNQLNKTIKTESGTTLSGPIFAV